MSHPARQRRLIFYTDVSKLTPEKAEAMAKQAREDLAVEAAEAHAYLSAAGAPTIGEDGVKLSLVGRIRAMEKPRGKA